MPKYVFTLYVAGQTLRSLRAEANLQHLCEKHLGADYELTVIDVQRHPEQAEAANIFATPVTIRVAPPHSYKVIGDLSDTRKVLLALGIDESGNTPSGKEDS